MDRYDVRAMRDWHLDTARTFLVDAEAEFGFLERLGFRLASAEQLPLSDFPHRRIRIADRDASLGECVVVLRFDSDRVELSVYHDPRAEISLTLRERSSARPGGIDLYNVLRVAAPPAADSLPSTYSSSVTAPREILAELANLVRMHAGPWLRGDHAAFERAEAASILPPAV